MLANERKTQKTTRKKKNFQRRKAENFLRHLNRFKCSLKGMEKKTKDLKITVMRIRRQNKLRMKVGEILVQ